MNPNLSTRKENQASLRLDEDSSEQRSNSYRNFRRTSVDVLGESKKSHTRQTSASFNRHRVSPSNTPSSSNQRLPSHGARHFSATQESQPEPSTLHQRQQLGDMSQEAPPQSQWAVFYKKNKGLMFVLLAQVFGVLMNVTTRLLEIEGNHGEGMHPFQILFVRMTITTALSTCYMWYTQIAHFPFGLPEVRWLLFIRGIGGFFGVFGMYYSLLYLPLADATVITFIAPSLSCFLCSILINEPYTRMEQVGTFISFIGVTLIARPTSLFQRPGPGTASADGTDDAAVSNDAKSSHDYNHVTSFQRAGAVGVALIGVVGSALAFTAMRWIGKRAHPLLSVNYFSAWCTIVSGFSMAVLPTVGFLLPQGTKEWCYLIFLGFCGFTMQFLLSAGLQYEKSSRATNMVYTQMLFALFFDKLIFGTNPSLLSLGGSTLILSSAIYVAMQKESMKQREDARKALEQSGTSNSVEMSAQPRNRELRDEERGLVAGIDADDDEKANGSTTGKQPANGYVKAVG